MKNAGVSTSILIITGDAGESYECLYARHRLLEAGMRPVIAAPSKRRLHLVIHDFEPGWDTYVERPGYGAEADMTFDEVRVDDFDAVLVLGGRAPEYLRHDPRVLGHRRAPSTRKASGCSRFATASRSSRPRDLVSGRRVTAYENCRWEIEAAGATYVASDQAVRDGRIVTGQTWQSHPEFYRLVFACLSE